MGNRRRERRSCAHEPTGIEVQLATEFAIATAYLRSCASIRQSGDTQRSLTPTRSSCHGRKRDQRDALQNLNFNLIHDIAPVAGIWRTPSVLVVQPSFPARTIPEPISYAKAHPGKINMGSGGIGVTSHLQGELFKMMRASTWCTSPIAVGRPRSPISWPERCRSCSSPWEA
jgi:hypothetical protein